MTSAHRWRRAETDMRDRPMNEQERGRHTDTCRGARGLLRITVSMVTEPLIHRVLLQEASVENKGGEREGQSQRRRTIRKLCSVKSKKMRRKVCNRNKLRSIHEKKQGSTFACGAEKPALLQNCARPPVKTVFNLITALPYPVWEPLGHLRVKHTKLVKHFSQWGSHCRAAKAVHKNS